MTTLKVTLLLASLVSAPFAQVRTWGFSKDTVYQQYMSIVGSDTVRLINSGVDTLRFDSVHIQLVHPTATNYDVIFDGPPFTASHRRYFVAYDSGVITYSSFAATGDPRTIATKAQDTVKLFRFEVGRNPLIVTKRAAIEPGDTVAVRMIFMASAGRGRDTLMVVGREQFLMGVQPAGPGVFEKPSSNLHFDPLGRRVDVLPGGTRNPATPLLTPKD